MQNDPPPVVTACATTDVTIGAAFANLCQYFPPHQNDSESLLNASGFAGITSWDQQWRIGDGDKGADGPLQLSLTGLNTLTGEVELRWTGGPGLADIALVVKAASEFHAYYFHDLNFGSTDGSYGATYRVSIYNDRGIAQDLSHLSLYSAFGRTTDPEITLFGCALTACGPTPTGEPVPAPAPLALIGLGLAGLALRRRRGRSTAA